jgi:2-keto-4-pentenoate hydratase/2-oxohepta-3-ene-1,7-dioic acid hydratase in catechol pathway
VVQKSNTSDLIFDVLKLVQFISGVMTLEPGNVIATGTPPGVGPLKKRRCGGSGDRGDRGAEELCGLGGVGGGLAMRKLKRFKKHPNSLPIHIKDDYEAES